MRGHGSQGALRFEERRQRERTAQRLSARVPALATLRLQISEDHGVIAAAPKYVRLFTVDSPSLFAFSCANPSCRDGGHEMTIAVLRGLLAGKTQFALDQRCEGNVRTAECGHTLHVEVTATFRA